MTTLICSCCGDTFHGLQDVNHDNGFGICDGCESGPITNMVNHQLDTVVQKIENGLSAEKAATFKKRTIDWKRNFALKMIEKGLVSYSF